MMMNSSRIEEVDENATPDKMLLAMSKPRIRKQKGYSSVTSPRSFAPQPASEFATHFAKARQEDEGVNDAI